MVQWISDLSGSAYDKDHIHRHLVTNSVSYEDGRKLHNTKKGSGTYETAYQSDVPRTWTDRCRKGKHLMEVRLKRGSHCMEQG